MLYPLSYEGLRTDSSCVARTAPVGLPVREPVVGVGAQQQELSGSPPGSPHAHGPLSCRSAGWRLVASALTV
jgi:hypothetical protein